MRRLSGRAANVPNIGGNKVHRCNFLAGDQPAAHLISPRWDSLFFPQELEGTDLSGAPPFTLADIRAAIPEHCWERDAMKSMGYLIRDVAIILGLAAGAFAINNACVRSASPRSELFRSKVGSCLPEK
jgi:hypothetical protein